MYNFGFFRALSKPLFTQFPKKVEIIEVGARDGLQNIKEFINTQDKIKLLDLLTMSGFKEIEVTSFVNPKAVPQFIDAAEVFEKIVKEPDCNYQVLVPNVKGVEQVVEKGVKTISIFLAATEAFSKKNINCTVEEGLKRLEAVSKIAKEKDIRMRGYVSCAFDCPYSGKTDKNAAKMMVSELLKAGCYEVSVADTIGTAASKSVNELLEFLLKDFTTDQLALHFHDTYGQGLTNVLTSLTHGIYKFDSSIGGLGGCPFAGNQASGNLATEDLLYLFRDLNIETGIKFATFLEALEFLSTILPLKSKSAGVLLSNKHKFQ